MLCSSIAFSPIKAEIRLVRKKGKGPGFLSCALCWDLQWQNIGKENIKVNKVTDTFFKTTNQDCQVHSE